MSTPSLHRLTVTAVDEDDGVTAFTITHCPQDDWCAVWHECHVDGCLPPQDVDDAEEGDHLRHGGVHRYLDYGWFERDDPHNCGLRWADGWDWPKDVTPGEYTCDVDYEDGQWYAVDIERAKAVQP